MFSKFKKRSLHNALKTPDAESLKQAETMWIREAQKSLKTKLKSDLIKDLTLQQEMMTSQGMQKDGLRLAMITKI